MQGRAQEILRERLAGIVETYDETSKEIQSTLAQMAEAFELLMAQPDQAQPNVKVAHAKDEDGLEWEDVAAEHAAEGWLDTHFLPVITHMAVVAQEKSHKLDQSQRLAAFCGMTWGLPNFSHIARKALDCLLPAMLSSYQARI